ncbi:MAG TPA: hypothetical protein DEP72_05315 [Clostridiales bacterium]|nr:MAG: hypothetical protein A2Y18_08550 [Clostridiales bacterium GWD2_32_19]HCC07561.1 hypothetical protein [Clostridiales bacterium]
MSKKIGMVLVGVVISIIVLIIIVMLPNKDGNQEVVNKEKYDILIPFIESGKYGYKSYNGQVVVKPQYDNVELSEYGVGIVERDGKLGFVNSKGEEVLAIEYNDIESMYNGYFKVTKDDKCGIVDANGNMVVPIKYLAFYPGEIMENKVTYKIDSDKIGFVELNGKEVTQAKYEYTEDFSNGMAAVMLNEKWGYINSKGKEVINFEYEDAQLFNSKGYAVVTKRIGDKQMEGIINTKGTLVSEDFYDNAVCYENFYVLKEANNENQVFINIYDYSGKLLYAKANSVEYFKDDKIIVISLENKYIILDNNLKKIKEIENCSINDFSNGVAVFSDDDQFKKGVLDVKGEKIIPAEYDEIEEFINNSAVAQKGSKVGVIDKQNNIIIPFEYDEINDIKIIKADKNNYYAIKQNDRYGLYDATGKKILDNEFEEFFSIKNNLVIVEKDEEMGLYNLSGDSIIHVKDCYISFRTEGEEVLIYVEDSGKTMYYNNKGILIGEK